MDHPALLGICALAAVLALVAIWVDRRAAERTRSAEERFRASFDLAPIGMAVLGLDGRFVEVNGALCELTGRPAATLRALRMGDVTHPDDLALDAGPLRATMDGEQRACRLRKRFVHAAGHEIYVDCSISVLHDAEGAARQLIAQIEDVTDRHLAETELRFLADHDGLTGLLNRRRFEQELARQAALAARYGDETALLVLDLDHFKQINDSLGHAAGDLVLRGVAGILRHRTRSSDVVARLGGDEFALLLMRAAADQAAAVAADIAREVREWTDFYGGEPLRTTTSIGIAVLGDGADGEPELAMRRADQAMYAAKAAGRDGLMLAGPAPAV